MFDVNGVYDGAVDKDCSEVKCAKVIHDIFDKLKGLCRARDGLTHYRYAHTILPVTYQ